MSRQVPWLRVFVEGVVIVGSILLAFGIDAWWAGKSDAALERTYLEGMREEFRAAEVEIAELIEVHEMRESGLLELHRLLQRGEAAAVPDSALELSHMLWTVSPFAPEMPTYQNLLESRGPSVLQDVDLRDSLRDYETVLGANRAWDDYLVAFDRDLMIALLLPRLPYFSTIFDDGDVDGALRPDMNVLAGDMAFRNLIAIRYSGERVLVGRRGDLIEAVGRVRRLLDVALAR